MVNYNDLKHSIDRCLAFVLLALLSPLLVIGVSICILVGTRDIIFHQERTGLKGAPFKIYKFRTMNEEEGRMKISRVGRILRSTSIDELPSLVNILKGEMSFVGPRPLRHIDVRYLSELEMERYNVLPGLTGLAQVNGRNSVTWENRFRYDLRYIREISLGTDLMILLKTVWVVLLRKNIDASEDTTMPELRYREK